VRQLEVVEFELRQNAPQIMRRSLQDNPDEYAKQRPATWPDTLDKAVDQLHPGYI